MALVNTHVLVGPSASSSTSTTPRSSALGCTEVCTVRNYVGDDDAAGDLVVLSLDLSGQICIYMFAENFLGADDTVIAVADDDDEKESLKTPTTATASSNAKSIQCLFQCSVENSTGTTAALAPPRVFTSVAEVVVAVGCLDGTIVIVSTGIATPNAKKEASPAGTIIEYVFDL
jgi:hypothetical protein